MRKMVSLLSLVLTLSAAGLVGALPLGGSHVVSNGDANADGRTDVGDSITILNYRFTDASLSCEDAADANDDGAIDLADGMYILQNLFFMLTWRKIQIRWAQTGFS